jgi:hypothetical protein
MYLLLLFFTVLQIFHRVFLELCKAKFKFKILLIIFLFIYLGDDVP